MKLNKRVGSFLLFCCLYWCGSAIASLALHIDPPTVRIGEIFRLILTLDNTQSTGVPDLTGLEPDFTLVGNERRIAYSIINGQSHSTMQWTVSLLAKKSGTLPIPPIQWGQESTVASTINVSAAETTTEQQVPDQSHSVGDTTDSDLLLTAAVSDETPFVNQQVTYTIKLYNSKRLLDAEYQPPQVKDALLIPLGDGRRYQTMRHRQTYAVLEQQYAIFPQKSGKLDIIPPSFNALVYDDVPRRVHLRSKGITLNVKHMPKGLMTAWLPSKQVSLTESYTPSKNKFIEGDTFIRTVILKAVGVPAQWLPALTFKSEPHLSVYPENPTTDNTVNESNLIGVATTKVTYVLHHAGRITVPALALTWFNTTTGKEETTSLPPLVIEVTPKVGGIPQIKGAETGSVASLKKHVQVAASLTGKTSVRSLIWILLMGVVLAYVIGRVFNWLRRRIRGSREKRWVLSQLRIACVQNNPLQARDALLRWALLQWPNVRVLHLGTMVKLVTDTALRQELNRLSQVLYSQQNTTSWRGDALWREMTRVNSKRPPKCKKKNDLPPINP